MPAFISSKEDDASNLYRGRAKTLRLTDNESMQKDAWRIRLKEAVEASGRSKRSISLEAKCGPGYLHSILSEGKDPTIENLMAVCNAIGVSDIYILHGAEASREDIEFLEAVKSSPGAKDAILALLAAFSKR